MSEGHLVKYKCPICDNNIVVIVKDALWENVIIYRPCEICLTDPGKLKITDIQKYGMLYNDAMTDMQMKRSFRRIVKIIILSAITAAFIISTGHWLPN